MGPRYDLRDLPPDQLLTDLACLLARDCQQTADLLAHLAEVDARKLYLDQAASSMFTYCVDRLHMPEPTAYKRIEAGRLARRFPVVFDLVADGRIHLTALALLAPKLTEDNHRELLAAAVHKSKRQIERLLAARFPSQDVPPSCRKVPEPACPAPAAAPSAPAPPSPVSAPPPPAPLATQAPAIQTPAPVLAPARPFTLTPPEPPRPQVTPLSADRYCLKLTVSAAVHDKLFEAQALLRHAIPSGDLDLVLGRALDALLRDLRRGKFAETPSPRAAGTAPRPGSRHIPNEVKRQVAARDGHQCTFVDASGRRCEERGMLEFHHIEPFARGGASDAASITLRCRGHNLHAAAHDFGELFMRRQVEDAGRARASGTGSPGRS
jgi:hypothetical protein